MPKFDWNGNGKKDNFDRFMDMKIMSDLSKNTDDNIDDEDIIDDFDDSDDLFEEESEDIENDDIDDAVNQQIVSNKSKTIIEGSF